MKNIKLTQGQLALVDDEDYEELKRFKWCAAWDRKLKSFYAHRAIRLPSGRWTTETMHRRILGLQLGDKTYTDHINHDTLDNRRENLKQTTSYGNHENRRNQAEHGAGVYRHPRRRAKPFQVGVVLNCKRHYLGCFATPEEARTARRKWLDERGFS